MDNIVIRHIVDFEPGFVEGLCQFEIENLGAEASVNQWMIPVLIRYGLVSVAERQSDKMITGVCEVLRSYRHPSHAFIHSFYIRPPFRGKKLGKLLLGEVLKKLKTDDFKKVQLTVDPANIPAVTLYSSSGFTRMGMRKDEYGKGVDRDLYVLDL